MAGCGFVFLLLIGAMFYPVFGVCGLIAPVGLGAIAYLKLRRKPLPATTGKRRPRYDDDDDVFVPELVEEGDFVVVSDERDRVRVGDAVPELRGFAEGLKRFARGVLNFFGSVVFLALFVGFIGGLPLFVKADAQGEGLVESYTRSVTDNWNTPVLQLESRINYITIDPATAEAKLKALFQGGDYAEVLNWGRAVFETFSRDVGAVPGWNPQVAGVSDQVAAHTAYRRLMCAPGSKETDLADIQGVVERSIPAGVSLDELKKWAEVRITERAQPLSRNPRQPIDPNTAYPQLPKLPYFRWWVIYDQWLPVESMYNARIDDAMRNLQLPASRFGRDPRNALVAFGEDVEDVQRGKGRVMPPASRNTSLMAAFDQLTGRYNEGSSIPVVERLMRTGSPLAVVAFYVLFPNERLTALTMGGGLEPRDWKNAGPGGPGLSPRNLDEQAWAFILIPATVGILILGGLVSRGMRFITIGVLAAMLGIGQHPYKVAYSEAMRRRMPRFLSTIGIIVVSFGATYLILQPFFVLYIRSEYRLLLIVIWTTILGGVLIEGLRNVITLIFVRSGVDPLSTIWDDLTAAALGGLMLWLFQNNYVAIAASVAVGLMPGLLYKYFAQKKRKRAR